MTSQAEANRVYWERRSESALSMYDRYGIAEPATHRAKYPHLSPRVYLNYAFDLLITGYRDKGLEFTSIALEAAQQWIRNRQPSNLYGPQQFPYKEINLSLGQNEAYASLHIAEWFMTGRKDLKSLRSSNEHSADYYELRKQKLRTSIRTGELSLLMLHYVEAEQYEEALKLFHEKFKGNKETPTNLKFSASKAQTCAALAEYCLGNSELESLVRGALESRFKRVTKWSSFWEEPFWEDRLRWAYLRAKYFKETHDLPAILADLRGY